MQNDLHRHFTPEHNPGPNWHAIALVAIVVAFWGALLWFLI